MDILSKIFWFAPAIIAPGALVLLSCIAAYVLRFGKGKTGLYLDFFVFALFVVVALQLGGSL